MPTEKTAKQAIPRRGLSTTQLKAVEDYIHNHLDARITIAKLAEIAHLSEFHFARVFKESTRMTPYRYVRN